jgi:hypothetical protein
MATFGIPAADFATGAGEGVACGVVLTVALLDAPAIASFKKSRAFSAAELELISAAAPHFVQNLVSPLRAAPHRVQNRCLVSGSGVSPRRAPHFVQNASRSVSAAPHCLQRSDITASAVSWLDRSAPSSRAHFLILAIS